MATWYFLREDVLRTLQNKLNKATNEARPWHVLTSLDIFLGELPVSALRLISEKRTTSYHPDQILQQRAGPGFTLPANIGDLDPSITLLDLRRLNLKGNSNCTTFLCCWDFFTYLFVFHLSRWLIVNIVSYKPIGNQSMHWVSRPLLLQIVFSIFNVVFAITATLISPCSCGRTTGEIPVSLLGPALQPASQRFISLKIG